MNLHDFLVLGLVLFSIGLYQVLARQHLIGVLIGVELMLNAASLNFMAFNRFTISDPTTGQVFTLFIIGLAAAEVAIALSIVLAFFRSRRSPTMSEMSDLRG